MKRWLPAKAYMARFACTLHLDRTEIAGWRQNAFSGAKERLLPVVRRSCTAKPPRGDIGPHAAGGGFAAGRGRFVARAVIGIVVIFLGGVLLWRGEPERTAVVRTSVGNH